MSVDSIDLEGLERKDRAELATIAQALGGKPGSRAKKADIVAMILELAGVTAGDAPSDDAGATAAGSSPEEPAEKSAEAPEPAESSDESSGDGAAAEGRSDDSRPEGDQPPQRGDGQSNGNQDQGSHDQDGQEGEGGGRRRRRRRGRDRNDDGDSTGQPFEGELVEVAGVLDLRDEGYGFLRVNGLLPSRDDVYVSVKQTRQLGLRRGDWITGASRPANRGEKNPALLRVDTVNGGAPESSRERPHFDQLVPLFPEERLRLERDDHPYDLIGRMVDMIAPIGKGQRGLIVAPPKAGKTTVLKTLAQCIEANHPEAELMVLLLDERPEEVTDLRRSIEGAVVASTFDRPPDEHIQVAELAVDRAKRMVEQGQDVVIVLDGITRLSRAYNLAAPSGGRIMSGGLDTAALYPPKRFFGAARNVEDGGSLTIIATALVETGSKMDEVIFEEFKGTGNMELRLDRSAAEQRIFPAIDVAASSTRHEELLLDRTEMQRVHKLRRIVAALAAEGDQGRALEHIYEQMKKLPTNEVFLAEVASSAPVG